MGQFDTPTEAALSRLKSEALQSSSVDGPVGTIAGIGSKLLELFGFAGSSYLSDITTTLMGLAARKDEENLIFFGEALADDIRRLYRHSDELRKRVDVMLKSSDFEAAVANATLFVVRTNIKARLKRLANVISNGVKESDLEPESLDDMMRLAVTLTEADVFLLGIVYEMQKDMLSDENLHRQSGERTNHLTRRWQEWWNKHAGEYTGLKGFHFKNSCARLLAAGLVGPVPKSYAGSPNANDLELLIDGFRFYERLQDM